MSVAGRRSARSSYNCLEKSRDRMLPFEKRNCTAIFLIAALIFIFSFAQPSHCLWLKKTANRSGQEPNEAVVQTTETQKGRIVFGRVLGRDGTGAGALMSQDVDGAQHSHAGDDTTYQADQSGQGRDASARVAREAWQNMFPSLQCTKEHMRFRAVGSGAPHVLIGRGSGSPLPIFQVPSTCGYNVHRNALILVMSVPYDGCYVAQEGGSYVLPLHWLGTPVSLLCPKLNPETTTAMPSTTTRPTPPPREPEIPQNHQYQLVPILNHNSPPVPAAATPLTAKSPHGPNPFYLTNSVGNLAFPQPYPYYFQMNHGVSYLPPPPTAAPVVTTTPPAGTIQSKPPPADPVAQIYPFPYPPYSNLYPWQLPNPQSTVHYQFPVYPPYPIPMPSYNYPPAAPPQVASQMPTATVRKEDGAMAPSSYMVNPNWQVFQMPGQSPGKYVKYQRNAFPENSGFQHK